MRARIAEELVLLRHHYPGTQHLEHGGEDWFLIPDYRFSGGWRINGEAIERAPIVFKIGVSYPIGEPYGFAAPAGVNFKGLAPNNQGSPVSPPFPGAWQHFSWAPDGWHPTDSVGSGSNLLVWARSFAHRLSEGA